MKKCKHRYIKQVYRTTTTWWEIYINVFVYKYDDWYQEKYYSVNEEVWVNTPHSDIAMNDLEFTTKFSDSKEITEKEAFLELL